MSSFYNLNPDVYQEDTAWVHRPLYSNTLIYMYLQTTGDLKTAKGNTKSFGPSESNDCAVTEIFEYVRQLFSQVFLCSCSDR